MKGVHVVWGKVQPFMETDSLRGSLLVRSQGSVLITDARRQHV